MQKQHITNRRYSPLSLARQGSAHTVLLRMAEDEGRAARIAELKERHPRLTWRKIADEVGVSERAATQWQRTGALKPENAERLADLFGVDFDYIWLGPRPDTPDMFVDRRNTPAGPIAVNRLEGELETRISAIEEHLDSISGQLGEIHEQRKGFLRLLAEQTRLLELIGELVGGDALRERADEAVTASIERTRGDLAKMLARASAEAAPDPSARG